MTSMMSQIIGNEALGGGFFRMRIAADDQMLAAVPGQFVMIRVGTGRMPLLRRPFSIHRLAADGSAPAFEILYRVVGGGTRAMSAMKSAQAIDVLGPLGKGFEFDDFMQRVVIMAGGVGVAPMVFLAEQMVRQQRAARVDVFLGAQTRDELHCRADFEQLGCGVHVTTDDGSCGDQCRVTLPAEASIRTDPPDMTFACGPVPMLRCVVDLARAAGVRCQISIEAAMACGLGACLGCAVRDEKTAGNYLHACIDGPVFPADRIRI